MWDGLDQNTVWELERGLSDGRSVGAERLSVGGVPAWRLGARAYESNVLHVPALVDVAQPGVLAGPIMNTHVDPS